MKNAQKTGCLPIIAKLLAAIGEKEETAPAMPYELRPYLLTKAEHSFYGVLKSFLPDNLQVMAKVRLADLIRVKPRSLNYAAANNKIISKHVDFVICKAAPLMPCVVIELNDKSHDKPDRVTRDHFLREALQAANLPLVEVKAAKSYNTDDIMIEINRHLPD